MIHPEPKPNRTAHPAGSRRFSGQEALPATIPACMEHFARQYRNTEVARYVEKHGGECWRALTWTEYMERINRYAAALSRLGLSSRDCVAIALPTSIEWDCLDKAVLENGAVVAGIEPHAPVSHWIHVLKVSRPTVLVVDTIEQLEPIPRNQLRQLAFIIARTKTELTEISSLPIYPWSILDDGVLEGYSPPRVSPADAAVMIFSSGTTGEPRGILYTHQQVLAACRAILERFDSFTTNDRTVSWLPMANLFQRMINLCAMQCGVSVYFHSDPRTIMNALPAIRPSVFVGVPRFYLKLYQGVRDRILRLPFGIGEAIWRSLTMLSDEQFLPLTAIRWSAPWLVRLVARRLKSMLGGSMKFMVTGSAPCPIEVLRFFERIGIPLFEAYGVSENITPISLNSLNERKLGSVGRPLSGNAVKIGADGEVLVRGSGLAQEYAGRDKRPIALDAEGYYHTGDTGSFDDDGFLTLYGRIADTVKLSNGRRVNLNEVETRLACVDGIDQIVAIGHGRPCIVGLISLGSKSNSLEGDRAQQISGVTRAISSIQRDWPKHLRLQGAIFLRRPLSIQRGELTPNFKVKRRVLEENYTRVVDRLYDIVDQTVSREVGLAYVEAE